MRRLAWNEVEAGKARAGHEERGGMQQGERLIVPRPAAPHLPPTPAPRVHEDRGKPVPCPSAWTSLLPPSSLPIRDEGTCTDSTSPVEHLTSSMISGDRDEERRERVGGGRGRVGGRREGDGA
eukprot:764736-Hanusia_phi.AAC.1